MIVPRQETAVTWWGLYFLKRSWTSSLECLLLSSATRDMRPVHSGHLCGDEGHSPAASLPLLMKKKEKETLTEEQISERREGKHPAQKQPDSCSLLASAAFLSPVGHRHLLPWQLVGWLVGNTAEQGVKGPLPPLSPVTMESRPHQDAVLGDWEGAYCLSAFPLEKQRQAHLQGQAENSQLCEVTAC
ncbi:putative uncharacterized protein encoded by LINC00341 [Nycticebus coucang]|uniref:putative uncharacterized protein encoded by LINC00341 n=1 Tax=Nycticebus coucang TaxID=9470 RepID=UPI00234CE46D|nr:putative uncharacterized protein encoded by LINC00341 [Nycticebus coucang]